LKELIQGGIPLGSNILVEFEPDSLWYETSFTIAASILAEGGRVEYHTYVRAPKEVDDFLSGLVPDSKRTLVVERLRIIDSYNVQIGLNVSGETRSMNLSDLSIRTAKRMKAREVSLATLHIDDNSSILLQYNDEKTFVDVWRTRNLPQTRVAQAIFMYGLIAGVGSPSVFRQLESVSDGIVDFKTSETEGGQIEHLMRVRTMRGKICDSRWRRLNLNERGNVTLAN
jgi:KaiC/GvpD/RAD55 family RecA-like ATPase